MELECSCLQRLQGKDTFFYSPPAYTIREKPCFLESWRGRTQECQMIGQNWKYFWQAVFRVVAKEGTPSESHPPNPPQSLPSSAPSWANVFWNEIGTDSRGMLFCGFFCLGKASIIFCPKYWWLNLGNMLQLPQIYICKLTWTSYKVKLVVPSLPPIYLPIKADKLNIQINLRTV